MKSKLTIIFLLTILSFSLNSCKKEDFLTGSMSCKIDGISWSSITQITVLKSGFFNITATSMSGQVLNITIKGQEVGTYELDVNNVNVACAAIYKPDISDENQNFASKAGTVKITEIDTQNLTISGTFSFELTDVNLTSTKSITEGKFTDLPYTNQDEK